MDEWNIRHQNDYKFSTLAKNLYFGAGIFFKILAHPVYKIWIMQEPKKVALWNKLHFEEEKMESAQHV
jgi:hypothetical protein